MRWDDDSSELSSFVSIGVKSGYVRALVQTTPNPQSINKANESIATTIEARKKKLKYKSVRIDRVMISGRVGQELKTRRVNQVQALGFYLCSVLLVRGARSGEHMSQG